MPVTWYRSHDEAERDLAPSANAELGIRTALALARLDEATRRGIRISPRGVQRFRTIAEAEAERERYALERLREADAEGAHGFERFSHRGPVVSNEAIDRSREEEPD